MVLTGATAIALMLGIDYQTQKRVLALACERWLKGDPSLLPDIVWSQPGSRDMMEREMGYPFGRPDLAPATATQLESPFRHERLRLVEDGYSRATSSRTHDHACVWLVRGFKGLMTSLAGFRGERPYIWESGADLQKDCWMLNMAKIIIEKDKIRLIVVYKNGRIATLKTQSNRKDKMNG